jgi:hypothetical protein
MAYFRKRKTQRFGSHWVGVPDAAPLEIRLDLPGGRHSARLLNLSTGKIETRTANAKDSLPVAANTSDDYVLIVTGGRVRLEL